MYALWNVSLPHHIHTYIHTIYTHLTQEVPASISALCHLENLNLDENSLFSVPSELGTLSQLNILSLRANNLTELPSEIGGLTNLSVLNVVGNRYYTYIYCTTNPCIYVHIYMIIIMKSTEVQNPRCDFQT